MQDTISCPRGDDPGRLHHYFRHEEQLEIAPVGCSNGTPNPGASALSLLQGSKYLADCSQSRHGQLFAEPVGL